MEKARFFGEEMPRENASFCLAGKKLFTRTKNMFIHARIEYTFLYAIVFWELKVGCMNSKIKVKKRGMPAG